MRGMLCGGMIKTYQYEKKNLGTEVGKQPDNGNPGGKRVRRGATEVSPGSAMPKMTVLACIG